MDLVRNICFRLHLTFFTIMEQRNIFSSIQIPGSKPGDKNWNTARWGYPDWDSLFNNMIENSDSEEMDQTTSEKKMKNIIEPAVIDIAALDCMQPYLNEPKQKKITSFFKQIKNPQQNDAIAPNQFDPNKPSTSRAYFESTKRQKFDHSAFLTDTDNDEWLCEANTQKTVSNATQKPNETTTSDDCSLYLADDDDYLFFFPDAPKPLSREMILHNRNLAKVRKIDRLDFNRMKNAIEDVFWPIHDWPPFIVAILLSPTFTYNERLTLATFLHGNGLANGKTAVSCVQIYNEHCQKNDYRKWKLKLYKFEQLFPFLDKAQDPTDECYNQMRKKYYYYSMMTKHMMYYNGDKRKNGKPQKFEQNKY